MAKKQRFWREIFRRHVASELSVWAFCRREKIAESAFYFWRKTLRQQDVDVRSDDIDGEQTAPSENNINSLPTAAFVPVTGAVKNGAAI